jgi:hypothetical protein
MKTTTISKYKVAIMKKIKSLKKNLLVTLIFFTPSTSSAPLTLKYMTTEVMKKADPIKELTVKVISPPSPPLPAE